MHDERAATRLPTGTVTFLMTDIEGSTRGWAQSPAALSAAVPRHYQILDEEIVAQGGVRPVEQGEGDSVVAAFGRASDAVHAAVLAQRRLAAEEWPENIGLRVRMALHTGEAQLRDEHNYFGVALILCARIRACGHGGQILLSDATAQLAADALPDDATLADLGRHRLKDLPRPERLWQLTHPDLEHRFPPLRSVDAFRHNLPVQLTSFVGREAELTVLDKLVPETRILTLTGSGGCGKTRLAIELAALLLDHHPDGAWVVELAPINDPDLVAPTALRALGLRDEQGLTAVETVTRYLRDRHAMLILDNCEHLLTACAELAEAVARACPSVHVLATSREPLTVDGEIP